MQVPWRYILDAVSEDQRVWRTLQGHCFRTLVVIKSMKISFSEGYGRVR